MTCSCGFYFRSYLLSVVGSNYCKRISRGASRDICNFYLTTITSFTSYKRRIECVYIGSDRRWIYKGIAS